ncbi:MAG: phage minor head protein [Pseudomonadota bacterium]
MARDTRAAFLRELQRVMPQFARAFEEAIQAVQSSTQRDLIEAAIQRGAESRDYQRAVQDVLQILNLDRELFAPLDTTNRNAFETGAAYQLSLLPKRIGNTAPRLVVRFQGRHPRAEAFTREQGARLITAITEGARTVVRETIVEALQQGRNYRGIARDLIGSPAGNQRKGAVIGLHPRQAQAVRAMRADLTNLDSRYFSRDRRDKRHDATVRKAIAEGRQLSEAQVAKITGRYADRLLKLRAENIARTETSRAMNAGRAEAIQQMVDSGRLPEEAITKIWDATPGARTRDSHRALNGKAVGFVESFVSPVTGASLQHPHDTNAPAEETVNCRCSARFRIDYAQLAV